MKITLRKSIILFTSFLGFTAVQAQYVQEAKVVSENREGRAEFGTSVAITENFAAVGSSREAVAAGAAYVYEKDSQGVWNFTQRLAAPDPNNLAEFGGAMKFSDDYLVVAAGRADHDGLQRTGKLYVYDYINGSWELDTTLIASDYSSDAKLGMNPTSLTVQGDVVIAGAPGENGWVGSVYVFTKVAGVWEESQKLLNPNPQTSDAFGIGVSVSGDYLLVGAQGVNSGEGACYIYVRNRDGDFVYEQTITASDAARDSYFGSSANISGDQIVVGAYGANAEQGSAYIFEKDIAGTWYESQILTGNPSTESAHYGFATTIQQDKVAVAAPHVYGLEVAEVYFYKKDENTGLWEEDQIIQGNDTEGQDFYGWSLGVYEDQMIVGAPREDHDVNGGDEMGDAGSAYIFLSPSVLGVQDNEAAANAIAVYPNPATDVLNVRLQNSAVKNIAVYGISGVKLMDLDEVSSIDASRLSAGVYVLRVVDENNEVFFNRFVKK